jgi:thiamine-monophosphate kinase
MTTVSDIGEAGLLARIQKILSKPHANLLVGVGDDAAVLRALGPTAVVSTDMLVEEVDFRRVWAGPSDIGHKAAAVNLSDLAAMGAAPRALLAAVAMQPDEDVGFILKLLKSLDATGRRFGAPLVGGDISKTTGPLVVSVTALGAAPKRRALRRHGAQVGDIVMVSGTLGGAALGLRGLQAAERVSPLLRRRQLRPEPRLALGLALGVCPGVHACADISDGLVKDVMHLVPPRYGVHLETARLPMTRGLHKLPLDVARLLAMAGGEDFELVFAVAARALDRVRQLAQSAKTPVTPIGQVIAQSGLWIDKKQPKAPGRGGHGFDHFA